MWTVGGTEVKVGAGFIPRLTCSQLLDLIKLMEGAGYDHFWCPNEKLYRDMWVIMGLAAANTRRLTVGTFIADPYSYHPALTAAAIGTVDEATEGRGILVLGAGGFSFQELGIKREAPLSALEESVHLIRKLFAGETVHLEGKVVEAHGAQLLFSVRPDIPIWIATRGNKTLELAGRVADGVMIATYAQARELAEALERVRQGCAAVQRDLLDMRVTVRVDICIDEDRWAARQAVKPMIAGMMRASHPDRSFVERAGLEVPEELAALMEQSFEEVYTAAPDLLPEAFVDAFAWAGTPEEVATKVAAVVDAGFANLCLVPHRTESQSEINVIDTFAQSVMPRVGALLG